MTTTGRGTQTSQTRLAHSHRHLTLVTLAQAPVTNPHTSILDMHDSTSLYLRAGIDLSIGEPFDIHTIP